MNISPFPGRTVSHPNPCFPGKPIFSPVDITANEEFVCPLCTDKLVSGRTGEEANPQSTIPWFSSTSPVVAALIRQRRRASKLCAEEAPHITQPLWPEPPPAPHLWGMKEPKSSYAMLYKLLTRELLPRCHQQQVPSSPASQSSPKLQQPGGSFSLVAPEPSAAFWAEQVDGAAAGDGVHAASLRSDLQPSRELTSVMAANATSD